MDTYPYCNIYKPYCKHPDYVDWVKDNCKKTCDLCPKGKADLKAQLTTKNVPPSTDQQFFFICLECIDRVSYCDAIKNRCTDPLIVSSMEHYCAKTCGVCQGKTLMIRYQVD